MLCHPLPSTPAANQTPLPSHHKHHKHNKKSNKHHSHKSNHKPLDSDATIQYSDQSSDSSSDDDSSNHKSQHSSRHHAAPSTKKSKKKKRSRSHSSTDSSNDSNDSSSESDESSSSKHKHKKRKHNKKSVKQLEQKVDALTKLLSTTSSMHRGLTHPNTPIFTNGAQYVNDGYPFSDVLPYPSFNLGANLTGRGLRAPHLASNNSTFPIMPTHFH
jgi:hypothetical protein